MLECRTRPLSTTRFCSREGIDLSPNVPGRLLFSDIPIAGWNGGMGGKIVPPAYRNIRRKPARQPVVRLPRMVGDFIPLGLCTIYHCDHIPVTHTYFVLAFLFIALLQAPVSAVVPPTPVSPRRSCGCAASASSAAYSRRCATPRRSTSTSTTPSTCSPRATTSRTSASSSSRSTA